MIRISTLMDRAKFARSLSAKLGAIYNEALNDSEKQDKMRAGGITLDHIVDAMRTIDDYADLIMCAIGEVEIPWPPTCRSDEKK